MKTENSTSGVNLVWATYKRDEKKSFCTEILKKGIQDFTGRVHDNQPLFGKKST